MTKNDDPNPNPILPDYERSRALNIVRNNARLRELGLISSLEEKQSNATAWGLSVPIHNEETKSIDKNQNSEKQRKRKAIKTPSSPVRKSARLQGLSPSVSVAVNDTRCESLSSYEERRQRRQAIIEECRQARQRAAIKVMEASAEKAAKENPTATYEHCLMRVRTMSEQGLKNRIKAIERAVGKHCVVKMAIFKSCLQDEDMWHLAELATEALERLKALQAPPTQL